MNQDFTEIENKYLELESLILDPSVLNDINLLQKYTKEHKKLTPLVEKIKAYKKIEKELQDAKDILSETDDEELQKMATQEIHSLEEKKLTLEQELFLLMLPKDPDDEKNVIVEIRAGVGGEEAALFAGDLFRMYVRYAEKKGFKTSIIYQNPTDLGGYKEISFSLEGYGAFSKLKYERGVHRVQRVPSTESSGRIHTSAVTVAVLKEAEEVELDIRPHDLRIDTYCASGAGGQYVNKTESAIRITHLPTGIVVQCQDEKSQLKNKEQAMKVLRARLLEKQTEEQENLQSQERKTQVGTGDRSGRIRTYNFPQKRITDHRIGLTLYNLDAILDGDLDELLNALIKDNESKKLKKVET